MQSSPVKNHKSMLSSALLLSAVISLPAFGQSSAASNSVIPMTRIDDGGSRITLDGFVDEPLWQQVPVIDDMRVISPDTLQQAPMSTEVRIFYDDRGMYVGVIAEQDPDTIVQRMSARDQSVPRDGFIVSVDASGDGLYGYYLRLNLGGTYSDGTILPERQIAREWDGPWEGHTQVTDTGWSAELFIPWSMMALPQAQDDRRQIGIYFERDVSHRNENWSWPALPGTNPEYLSAFQKFELEGISPATQITFYPYSSVTHDSVRDNTDTRVGADLYWRPNANTQFSATLNPDFGTVESDNIVVNLSAFETFFSEKRTFFVEGQDVFFATPRARSGRGPGGPVTMLNTRRIGAAARYDTPPGVRTDTIDRNQPTDLLGAGKVTGQSGPWRYGALLAFEDDMRIRGVDQQGNRVAVESQGRDFGIGRLLYEDTTRGGRRSIGWMGTRLSHPDRSATVNGVDFQYFSADARWNINGQALHSDVEGTSGQGLIFDVDFQPRRGITHTFIGNLLDTRLDINDVGYLQRNDHVSLDYTFRRSVSGLERVRNWNTTVTVINQWNNDGRPVRLGLFLGQGYTLHNNQNVNFNLRYFPARVDDRLSRGNGTYKIPARYSGNIGWVTDRSRPVSLMLDVNSSQEDLGRGNLTYSAGVDWRPNDRFSLDTGFQYRNRDGWLIHQGGTLMGSFQAEEWGPRLNASYFITARQQFRLAVQWTGIKAKEHYFYRVNQDRVDYLQRTERPAGPSRNFTVSRLSFQARYRWEIAPLSDLFVVYTRGSNVPGTFEGEFQEMFREAWSDRIVDMWVVKLRYRFGS